MPLNTRDIQDPIGPARGFQLIDVGNVSGNRWESPRKSKEFLVQVASAGNVKVESSQGDLNTFASLSDGDTLEFGTLPLLCRAVVLDSDTTVTHFYAVFL